MRAIFLTRNLSQSTSCYFDHRILSGNLWRVLGAILVYTRRCHRFLTVNRLTDDNLRGWIIPSTVIFPQVLAIAELASSMPVNGSFYWWSGALAPSKYSNFVSFVSGWLNVLSMFSATAAFAYAVASSVAFSVNIVAPDFVWTNPQLMGLSISVILVWAALMSLRLESISVVFMAMGKFSTRNSMPRIPSMAY